MANQEPEIYVSVDIEADGPIPGPYSMLSLAAVAYSATAAVLGEFAVNLETLPGAGVHPKTKLWWEQFPEAWQACRVDPQPPQLAMTGFASWLEALPGTPIFVAWPATWDFMWVYWYLVQYTGTRPFSEHGIDIRSYAMGMRGRDFRRAGKNYLPKRWFSDQAHTHVALDDAKEQGQLFINMMTENTATRDA
ncbi:MAG: exonuclease [Gammaproteobacteria bacterium SG8_47]|nr:MAG: exonuclease [Gammaproteobacteria bacterium SG8_47]